MANKPFSWHREYYEKILKEISAYTESITSGSDDIDILGWLDWFEKNFPGQHKKYDDAVGRIGGLWGNSEPKAMEEFKKAVKIEVDATKWAVQKYVEWQKEVTAASKKGTQEVLV